MIDERLLGYLEQIKLAAERACVFVEGLQKADFLEDVCVQQAVVMSLLIVGEAATKVIERYPGFVDNNPTVPWQSMRGMRNRIAHGYFEIDLAVVWDTVQLSLPALLQVLEKVNNDHQLGE